MIRIELIERKKVTKVQVKINSNNEILLSDDELDGDTAHWNTAC